MIPTTGLTILDTGGWTNSPMPQLRAGSRDPEFLARLRQQSLQQKAILAFFAPRGVDPAQWPDNPQKAVQIRRRFMLLGETLDSIRVWDIQCAAQAIRSIQAKTPLEMRARAAMGVNAAYAALFESHVAHLDLADIPASHRQEPDYLNVLKITDIPEVLQRLGNRVEVNRK